MRTFTLRLLIFLGSVQGAVELKAQCPITVNAGDDIWLCQVPASVQLNGSISGNYLNFSWSPTAGMQGANTLNPTVNVNGPATFVLTGRAVNLNNNLIVNGDFEGGNYGFTSDYIYSPTNLVPEGTYAILSNPQSAHPGFAPCTDHTSGGGNMMVVNGAGTPGWNVWCQTVTVQPNTQYAFSAWVTSVNPTFPARLQFSINGNPIGPVFVAPSTNCTWLNFYTTWNSGASTSATICIVNQNTVLGGNDFALDDLVFSPICTETDTVRVHVVQIQAVAAPAISVIPCEGSPITLSGNGSSTGPNITYRWDTGNGNIVSGHNTLQAVVNAAGSYTLAVTFNNGFVECTKTATVNVIPTNNPLTAWITPPQPLGCGQTAVQLRGFTNQPAFAKYQWTSGPNGQFTTKTDSAIVWVNKPGQYTLTVTNAMTGCTAHATVTVIAATDPPVAKASASLSAYYCTSDTFQLSGQGSSEGPNFSYAWVALSGGKIVAGADSAQARATAPGIYILQVTNTSNGCATQDTVKVEDRRVLPVLSIDTPAVFTCLSDTLWLHGRVDSGAVSLLWLSLGGAPLAGDTMALRVGVLAPGTYVLRATDTLNFCVATDTVMVEADTLPPLAHVVPPDTLTCSRPVVTLSGAGSSEGAPFTYRWVATGGGNLSGSDTLLTAQANAPGIYTLQVTNSLNGCTATASVGVAADTDAIVAIANAPDTLTCTRTEAALNAEGSSSQPGLQYQWTTADGMLLSGANAPVAVAGAPGTYVLMITNPANGCTATDAAVVQQDTQPPAVEIAEPGVLNCYNSQLTLQSQSAGAVAFQYEWVATQGGHILSGAQTPTPVVNAPGTYSLTVVNLRNGCAAVHSVSVNIDTTAPVAHIAPVTPLTCAVPARVLDASGSSSGSNFDLTWTASSGGHLVSGTNGLSPVIDAAGTYTLTVLNRQNGCAQSASVQVTADTLRPPADAGPDGWLTCTFPAFGLLANAGQGGSYQYQWMTVDGAFSGNPNAIGVDATEAGVYVLRVTDPNNGCTATDTVQVMANMELPVVSVTASPTHITCEQLTVALHAHPAPPHWQLLWTTSDGNLTTRPDTATVWANAAGTYNLLVTNEQNGCTAAYAQSVAADTAHPLVSILPPDRITCAQPEVILYGQVGSSDTAFVFHWYQMTNGLPLPWTSLQPTTTQEGYYRLQVTLLRNGCTAEADVIVSEDTTKPWASAGQDTVLTCTTTTLTLQGNASGTGTPLIQWTAAAGGRIVAGAGTLSPVVDAPGVYTMVATDPNNGCSDSSSVVVLADKNAPQAVIAPPDTLTCARTQIQLQGSGSPATSVSANWTATAGGNIAAGAGSFSPIVNAPGRYLLTVVNTQNGCTATAEVMVRQDTAAPVVTVSSPPLLTCATTAVVLSAQPDTTAFSHQWQTTNGHIVSGSSSASASVDQPGVYVLTTTDRRTGCSSQRSVVVNANVAVPQISIAAPPLLTCRMPQVSLQATVSNAPSASLSAQWSTANGQIIAGAQGLSPTVSAPGLYVLAVQNTANGCTASSTATVDQDTVAPLARISAAPPITCAQRQVGLNASASTGKGALLFEWAGGLIVSGQNTSAPTVGLPDTYTLTLTDASNGCSAMASVVVPADTAAPVARIAPPLPLTCARQTTGLDASASIGQMPLIALWSTTTGQIVTGHQTLTPDVSAPGLYTLLLTNGPNGCTSSATVLVQEDRTPPPADAGPDQTLYCLKPEVLLSGQSTTPAPVSFSWTVISGGPLSGDPNAAQTATRSPGVYRLIVTQLSNGCSASDEVQVSAVPLPAFQVRADQPNCHRNTGTLSFEALSGGQPPFRYSIDGGQNFRSTGSFSGLSPGTYAMVLSDALGCTASAVAAIDPPFLPQVSFAQIAPLDLGDSVQLQPVLNLPPAQVADWQWTPADGLSCDDCPAPWASPLRSMRYRLWVLDANGCAAEASVLVPVSRSRLLYAPNIFSPNGDGINDRFTLYGNRGVTAIRSLQVFDRWGSLVFSGQDLRPNDESAGWDGSFRGQAVLPGVYVWQAVVAFLDGEEEVFTGDITVYR